VKKIHQHGRKKSNPGGKSKRVKNVTSTGKGGEKGHVDDEWQFKQHLGTSSHTGLKKEAIRLGGGEKKCLKESRKNCLHWGGSSDRVYIFRGNYFKGSRGKSQYTQKVFFEPPNRCQSVMNRAETAGGEKKFLLGAASMYSTLKSTDWAPGLKKKKTQGERRGCFIPCLVLKERFSVGCAPGKWADRGEKGKSRKGGKWVLEKKKSYS